MSAESNVRSFVIVRPEPTRSEGGLFAAKTLMLEGGLISCDAGRAPLAPVSDVTRAGRIEVARASNPVVPRRGK